MLGQIVYCGNGETQTNYKYSSCIRSDTLPWGTAVCTELISNIACIDFQPFNRQFCPYIHIRSFMIMIASLTIYNILRSYTICVEGLGAGEGNGYSHWHHDYILGAGAWEGNGYSHWHQTTSMIHLTSILVALLSTSGNRGITCILLYPLCKNVSVLDV